jgi:hypothetical protein
MVLFNEVERLERIETRKEKFKQKLEPCRLPKSPGSLFQNFYSADLILDHPFEPNLLIFR